MTDRTCSKCHQSKPEMAFYRRSDGSDRLYRQCKACKSAVGYAWGQANPDRRRAYQRRYQAAHPERRKESDRKYGATHAEQKNVIQRRSYRRLLYQVLAAGYIDYPGRQIDRLKALTTNLRARLEKFDWLGVKEFREGIYTVDRSTTAKALRVLEQDLRRLESRWERWERLKAEFGEKPGKARAA